ncbi:immunity 49 family protein [Saccharothrix sp. NRRL B-16348]|uniref:immunity 49 family protein n=1 Tax=Saccharothrix sp. NRRL B-16348 TaxID=1415542 RepID=UPI0006ADC398|nr:immunity 49 family protein [Saccharothrix sp. NRRL B-16348]
MPRHPVDADQVRVRLDVLDTGTERLVEAARNDAVGLASLAEHLLMLGQLGCVLDPRAEDAATRARFTDAAEAYSGYFAALTRGDVEPGSYAKVGNWLVALWLAVVSRDEERAQQLAAVPQDLLRASGTEYDRFMYDWVDSLQKFFRTDPALEDAFTATMNGTDPEVVTIASTDVLLDLLYPPIEMLYFVLRRDEERFNDSLERALTGHRRYWTTGGRETRSDGMVALAPLAISVLAGQVGIEVRVESDYLPPDLLSGAWVGETPTA